MPPPSPLPKRTRARMALHLAVAAGLFWGCRLKAASFGRRQQQRPSMQPARPPAFPYDCSPPANATAALLGPLAVQHESPQFPPWMAALCPEVVSHFTAFPYFGRPHPAVPTVTTVQAAHMVCTLKIMADIGGRVGTDVLLYAGTFVGALRHGGPVPWDDDTDLVMPFSAGPAFLEKCRALEHALHPDITVHCRPHSVFIKVYVEDKCGDSGDCAAQVSRPTPKPWRWPYADIFLYRTTATHWQESTPTGEESPRDHSYPLDAVFPSRRYYFGGVNLPGPRAEYANIAHPSWKSCVTSNFDHRKEVWANGEVAGLHLNCCEAARWVPFVVGNRLVGAGGQGIDVFLAQERRSHGFSAVTSIKDDG